MVSSAATADAPPLPTADTYSAGRRVLILIMVVLGSTLYATTLLIASTLLPQMQGTMSATQDEIAWAMTFNILATAGHDADDRLAGGAASAAARP
jgi:DHA2 family multidrug resistance protein